MENIYAQRIITLRQVMKENGWEAVVLGGSDPHNSEYAAPRWQQVKWLSGFTGEAGDLVITAEHAGLWTDSRYFIQAVDQLRGTGVELHKTRVVDEVSIPDWLAANVTKVVLDATAQSIDSVESIKKALEKVNGEDYKVAAIPDFLEKVWEDRPSFPISPIITLGDDLVGESRLDKISWLRDYIKANKANKMLISTLDDIAWTLNIRGTDIDYNPLVLSFLLVSEEDVKWYVLKDNNIDLDQETVDSFAELKADGIKICDYSEINVELMEVYEEGDKIIVDPASLNYYTYEQIDAIFSSDGLIMEESPIALRKSIKNDVEINYLREAHLEDGVAMEKFLFWLESSLASGESVSEWEASVKLTEFRSHIEGYRGNSFENISAYAGNGALPHYSTPKSGSAEILRNGLYLVDSGGQYIFGTTDLTRTVPMGECTDLEKEDYTLVLKGMIALSMAVFPRGTTGSHLDILARNPLWSKMRNFGHGTGHGVGFFLCVHEGPQSIRQNLNPQAILPGMVTSNEPAIYRTGLYGIRHENLLLCKERGETEFGDWLDFETLTLCHIDTSIIVKELMTDVERGWLNEYNERVFQSLSPYLTEEESNWLRNKTEVL